MATVSRSKPRRARATTAVYLIPVAEAVQAKSFSSEAEALDFEHDFNAAEKRLRQRKYIAVADVEHVIRPRWGAARDAESKNAERQRACAHELRDRAAAAKSKGGAS